MGYLGDTLRYVEEQNRKDTQALVQAVSVVLAALLVIGAVIYFVFLREVNATVRQVQWRYDILLEDRRVEQREGWQGFFHPADGAFDIHKEERQHGIECKMWTRDCRRNVNGQQSCSTRCAMWGPDYDTYVIYKVYVWDEIGRKSAAGQLDEPHWPDIPGHWIEDEDTRLRRVQNFEVAFNNGGSTYHLRPASLDDFKRFRAGEDWTVRVNVISGGATPIARRDR